MKLPFIISDSPVKIEKLVPGGQGLGTRADGIKGFFWNALPGETVLEYEVTKQKAHYFEAVAVRVSDSSAHRVEPRDECYLSTSPWQVMDYEFELEQKRELLADVLGQNLRSSPHNASETRFEKIFDKEGSRAPFSGYLDSNNLRESDVSDACGELLSSVLSDGLDLHYRNKMEYSLWFDKETEKISLAFHRRGSHRKIPVEGSSIERSELFVAAQKIVDELNAKHEDSRKYQTLLLRCNQNGEVSGGLYENGKPHPVFPNLTDTILGRTYSYSPNGFFQINLPVYAMALEEIKKHITSENVLDLYAGVGTIGLSVAREKNLTLVEVDKSAFAELEKNCRNCIFDDGSCHSLPPKSLSLPLLRSADFGGPPRVSPVSKIQCYLAKSEEAADFLRADQTVIVDPPRAGLDKKLVEKLCEVTPETLIYLSCNPATQARDLAFLLEKYDLKLMQPYNFFPRTPHLENLCVLTRR